MTKTVIVIAVVASVIMLLGAGVDSAYIVVNWRSPDRPNFDDVSPIPIIRTALTADSRVDIPVSNNNNSGIIFHNQTDTGEWLTYHHDFFRTGFDPEQLSPNNRSSSPSIKTSWTSDALDGVIYAEPLVAQGMVFVATSNNTIYSLNSITGKIVWRTNLGPAVPLSDLPCGNIDPTGIIGTPVIDLQTQTIFAVGFLGNTHTHELFGIDINAGKIRFEAPIDPPGSDPKVEQQRGALALSYYNGSSNNNAGDAGPVAAGGGVIVYVPFGGLYGDCGQYHG